MQAGQGAARRGMAWQGMARHGLARGFIGVTKNNRNLKNNTGNNYGKAGNNQHEVVKNRRP
jgi:hypothetical protein